MAIWRPTGRSITYHDNTTSQIILHNFPFSDENKRALPVPENFASMRIRSLDWSPSGSFCCAVFVPGSGVKQRDSTGSEGTENVLLWKVSINGSRAEIMTKFSWRRPSDAFDTPLKWSEDDRFVLYGISKHEILVHYSHEFNAQQKPITAIKTENLKDSKNGSKEIILDYSLSPPCDENFASVFVCLVTSDEESMLVRLLDVVPARSNFYNIVFSQALPKADRARITWAPSGGTVAILANLESSSDQYSGNRSAYVISNVKKEESTHLKTLESASLHAFSWSPTRDEFIAIKGTLPSTPELMDVNCNTRYSFPRGYFNSISWDGHGEKLILGGFGNLAGQLSIWYRDEPNQKMTSTAALRVPYTVTTEWNVHGTLALIASIYPRMKVDNHFKIYSPNGILRACVYFEQLYKVAFQPIILHESLFTTDPPICPSAPVSPTTEERSTEISALPDDLLSVLKRHVPDLILKNPIQLNQRLFKVDEKPVKTKPPAVAAGEFGAIGPANRRSRDEILQQDVYNYLDKLSADFVKQWSERPQGVNAEIIDVLKMLKETKYREEILRLFIAQCFAPDFRKASFYWHSSILTRIIKQLMARNAAKARASQLLHINPTREQLANSEQQNSDLNVTAQEYNVDMYKAESYKNNSYPPSVAPVSGASQPSNSYAQQYGYYPGYGSVYSSQRNQRGNLSRSPIPAMDHKNIQAQEEANLARFGPPGMYSIDRMSVPGPSSSSFSQNPDDQNFLPPRLSQPSKSSGVRRGGQGVPPRGYSSNQARPRPTNTRLSAHAAEFMPSAASGSK
eukprot:GHVP01052942.1.p1 GENE.GHVP01052942.1~~GHVP01052942.1.p1  ORF type:complete len:898 (+),score=140.68 GHVP01052942.1:307-2694(+)